jgi:hypothetical protein
MATSADVNAFRAKFMELSGATDQQIAAGLNLADVLLGSGSNWQSQIDFREARLQLAAHQVIVSNMQAANAAQGVMSADLYLNTIHFGERSVGYGQRTGFGGEGNKGIGIGEAMLEITEPGMLFLQLRARNIIPVMLV